MEKPKGKSASGTTRYWGSNSVIQTLSPCSSLLFFAIWPHSFFLKTGLSLTGYRERRYKQM